MNYFVVPLYEATPDVYTNGSLDTPGTPNEPGAGIAAPYAQAIPLPGSRVFYKGGLPTPGSDTVLVVSPSGSAQDGWVEKTQAEAQALFPLAGV